MDFSFTNISVEYVKKKVLKNVYGKVGKGEILAVLGPSGAGKTTLLNALTGKIPLLSGRVQADSCRDLSVADRRHLLSHVMQEEMFYPNVTLFETLLFHAKLRLPSTFTHKDKVAAVREIAEILDLTKCLGTVVGNEVIRGLSGGEKKRAMIACEMLSNASVLLLDEPTTGLDSATAHNVILVLKQYVENYQKTVMLTIHQATSHMFYSFNKILVLTSNGKVGYFGSPYNLTDFLSRAGVHCSLQYNPADFVLQEMMKSNSNFEVKMVEVEEKRKNDYGFNTNSCSYGFGEAEDENDKSDSARAINNCLHQKRETNRHITTDGLTPGLYKKRETDRHITTDGLTPGLYKKRETDCNKQRGSLSEIKIKPSNVSDNSINLSFLSARSQQVHTSGDSHSFWIQYKALFTRNIKQKFPSVFSLTTICSDVFFALTLGLLWFQLDDTDESVTYKMWLLFYSMAMLPYTSASIALVEYFTDKLMLKKEISKNLYSLSAYYVSAETVDITLYFIKPSLIILVSYWMADMDRKWSVSFAQTSVILLAIAIQRSLATVFAFVINKLIYAQTAMISIYYCVEIIADILAPNTRVWLSWSKYTAYLYYSFLALKKIEFIYGSGLDHVENSSFNCSSSDSHKYGINFLLMKSQLESSHHIAVDIFVLLGFLIVCKILGYVLIKNWLTRS